MTLARPAACRDELVGRRGRCRTIPPATSAVDGGYEWAGLHWVAVSVAVDERARALGVAVDERARALGVGVAVSSEARGR